MDNEKNEKDFIEVQSLLKKEKLLIISVDPGFDSAKIRINQTKEVQVPSAILDITGQINTYLIGNEDEITYQRIIEDSATGGKTIRKYLIGSKARKDLNKTENRNNPTLIEFNKQWASDKKFSMLEFGVYLNTVISYALYEYSLDNEIGFTIEELDQWNIIRLSVALPHQHLETTYSNVKDHLLNQEEATLTVGDSSSINIKLNVMENAIAFVSQTLVAFKGLFFTDNGYVDPNELKKCLSKLPAVIIDGGYLTVGNAQINQGQMEVVQAESNETFAMKNINEDTATEINKMVENLHAQKYKTLHEYDIPNLEKDEVYSYTLPPKDEQSFGIINRISKKEILDIKQKVIAKRSQEFIKYLRSKFTLGEVELIVTMGGTGKVYYEPLKEHAAQYIENCTVINAPSEYLGVDNGPQFVIVNGQHKVDIYETLESLK